MMIPGAPLRSMMATLWVACIAGVVVIAALSLGWVGWEPFLLAGLIGLGLGIPAGLWTARMMRRAPS